MQQRERVCAFLSSVTVSDGKEKITSVGYLVSTLQAILTPSIDGTTP
jgi:hypothetical protein